MPPELHGDYDYLPGQYVALRAHVDGHELRRSYSICRPPTPGRISVAIKRDLGGRFSTWAHERCSAGDRIDVMSPEGTLHHRAARASTTRTSSASPPAPASRR